MTNINLIGLLIGWLLGVLSAIIADITIMIIKDRKIKTNLSCILKGEINLNLNSISKILNKELGWKFCNDVFNNFFEHIPLLGKKLSQEIIFFYYTLERKNREFNRFEDLNQTEMLTIWHSPEWEEMIQEWVRLQELGREISDELKEICKYDPQSNSES